MTYMLQLNPSIPVKTPKGTGECIAWLDYSKEDNLLWLVAMDDTGKCWLVPNQDISLLDNYSIGRNLNGRKHSK